MQIKKYFNILSLLIFFTSIHLTKAQIEPKLVLPIGHVSEVRKAIYCPSGDNIATTSYDGTIKIWDSKTGKLIRNLTGHSGVYIGLKTNGDHELVSYNPSGTRIVTANRDNLAIIWDSQTGALLNRLIGHSRAITSLMYNQSGSKIVTSSHDVTAKVWDARTGKLLHNLVGHDAGVLSAVYNSLGTQIVTASEDKTAIIWDAESGELLHRLKAVDEKDGSYNGYVLSASFNPSGTQIVTVANPDYNCWEPGSIKVWDAETGELLYTLDSLKSHNQWVTSAYFNATGSQIVTASFDGTAKIWDARTGKLLHNLVGHDDIVESAVYNSYGTQIVTASVDGTAKIWNSFTGELIHSFTSESIVRSAMFNPSGTQIVTGHSDNKTRTWDVQTGELLYTLEGQALVVETAQFKDNVIQSLEAYLYYGDVTIWDAQSGKLLRNLKGHTWSVNSAVYNATGSQIVTASDDNTARIWDAESGELLHTLEGHTSNVNSAVFNPMGTQIVTASWDSTARIWDAQSGELLQILKGHKGSVESAEFNANGSQIVTASDDRTARIWDAHTGGLLHTKYSRLYYPHSANAKYNATGNQILVLYKWYHSYGGLAYGLAYTYNSYTGELLHTLQGDSLFNSAEYNAAGTQVVTASDDSTAKIWDASTGELLQILKGHKGLVESAEFNANGSQILTTSSDGIARIWDASTGELLHTLEGHTEVANSAKFNSSSNYVITSSDDLKTIIWDAHTGKQLYTRLQLKGGDWLAYDEHYRFDGSPGGIDQLYLVCGLEVIDLNQVKDSLYVPGLVTQIMSGAKEVMMNDRPAPKLEDLQICELTPVVEPIDQDKTNRIRYRIIPRKGGLGNVEFYINNNLTYTYKPSDLKKEPNTKNYILEVNTDTLQQYFTGDKGRKNPIMIKPLIKGGGIYGRGAGSTAVKTVDRKSPKFIGVFVGVNDYNNPAKDRNNPSYYTDLSYAEADAESMAQAMEQSARTLFEDSVLIYRVTQQSNKAPTKKELEKVFDDISKKAKSEDVLYIFFAGHGGVPKTPANPNNEVRFMLQKAQKQNPMTTSFGLSDIRQWTNAQRMKAQKRVFVFDACHSGKFIQEIQNNMGGNLYASRGTQDQGWRKKQLDKLKDQTGMMILAASAEDQVSYEDPQLKHGVMTYHLLEQMKQMPQDTTLIIKDWFESSTQGVESFIDRKYTRSTDDPYKPVQSPEMFGSGKFAVGVVNNQVKESIELAKIKMTIGKIYFNFRSKPGREKETVHQWIYEYLQQNIDPKKMEIAVDETAAYVYTIKGHISWGDEYVSYDIIKQGKVIKKEIKLEGFNTKSPKQIAEAIAESIMKEIENIN